MARFITVKNKPVVLDEETERYDGETVSTQQSGNEEVRVVKFVDESAGAKFGVSLNGTVYRAEWAAVAHANQLR